MVLVLTFWNNHVLVSPSFCDTGHIDICAVIVMVTLKDSVMQVSPSPHNALNCPQHAHSRGNMNHLQHWKALWCEETARLAISRVKVVLVVEAPPPPPLPLLSLHSLHQSLPLANWMYCHLLNVKSNFTVHSSPSAEQYSSNRGSQTWAVTFRVSYTSRRK